MEAGDELIRVPKSLCFYSNIDQMRIPLQENAEELIKSFSESQWRARVIIYSIYSPHMLDCALLARGGAAE